jgi:hypothetical protein
VYGKVVETDHDAKQVERLHTRADFLGTFADHLDEVGKRRSSPSAESGSPRAPEVGVRCSW